MWNIRQKVSKLMCRGGGDPPLYNERENNMLVKRSLFTLMVAALMVSGLASVSLAQTGSQPVSVDLTLYEGNPILSSGEAGEWDDGYVWSGNVVYDDGLFHMFYGADSNYIGVRPSAIGYATSEDGLTWTKYAGNPIFTADELFEFGHGTGYVIPLVDGDTWLLYFTSEDNKGIYRGTASAPTGPWTIDPEPVLKRGKGKDWDAIGFALMSITRTDDEYVLYYWSEENAIGRATSPDGIVWTKYDDPNTADESFDVSDPIFYTAENGAWDDSRIISPIVRQTDKGWVMFYNGQAETLLADMSFSTYGIGFAYSEDGIHWTRFGDSPLLLPQGDSVFNVESLVIQDNIYYLYLSILSLASEQAGTATTNIGVITGTVTWEEIG
jgi:predicted GH43/DUF377 family glycosyl hydrolase